MGKTGTYFHYSKGMWVRGDTPSLRRFCILGLAALALSGCGSNPMDLDANTLSSLLSIGSLERTAIPDPNDPSRAVGATLVANVFHVGEFPIPVAFLMTWRLRDGSGETVGSASFRFDADFQPGAIRTVTMTISFPSRPGISDLQNVVTFDPIQT